MDSVIVTRKGLNRWEYYPPVKWPENKTVDFYAVSPSWIEMHVNIWWQNTIRYSNPEADTDLLISVRKDVSGSMGGPKLNFRHATAMIELSVRSTIEYPLQVRLVKAAIKDVADYGTFHFPDRSTSPDTNKGELFDLWHTYNGSAVTYPLFEAHGYMALSGQPVPLTDEGKFFIPFAMSELQHSGYWHGSRLELTYQIWDLATDSRVWPAADTDYSLLSKEVDGCGVAMISLRDATPEGRWVPGRSYRYSIDIKSPASMPDSRGGGIATDCEAGDMQ